MILAESSRYRIISEFETVFLEDTINRTKIVIGEFYGDPEGAFIDQSERFAVVYGCSLLIHPLDSCCQRVRKEFTSGQNDTIIWIAHAAQMGDDSIHLDMESGDTIDLSLFSDLS